MDVKQIRKVQDMGWIIEAATEDKVIARCPSYGCGLVVGFREDSSVQSCDPGLRRDPTQVPVGSFDDVRVFLRDRRETLCLSIRETEEVAGLSVDHIAKMEKEDPTRSPGFDVLREWAGALGYEFVLRPAPLTPYATRVLAQTRDRVGHRRRLAERQRALREREDDTP